MLRSPKREEDPPGPPPPRAVGTAGDSLRRGPALPTEGREGRTHTPVAFASTRSSCPPSTIFRAISWHGNLYFWAFCHSDKEKKKGTRKTSWVPAPNPNSKHETRPSPWTAFCVEHHSFSKSSRLEERASRLVLTRTTCLEGHLVKKEEARHMSMERTECFENLKATPSVPGTWTCHPLPPNTGSPLGKAPSQSWPSLRLRRRPWDALLALGCSATSTPGVWEGSSLRRAVTCDMGRDLAQTPPASKSQASAQRGGAARTHRGGRVSPACSQTRGALPDSQLSYGPIYRHSVNISFRSVDTKRKPEINLCRSDV